MELMALLNELYARFDRLVEEAGLWKVETVGDAYIVVGGLSTLDSAASASVHAASSYQLQTLGRSEQAARLHLDSVFHLSVRMLDELAGMREHLGLPLHMRVGVHCGDVVTGIVGSQRPRFCEFESWPRCLGATLARKISLTYRGPVPTATQVSWGKQSPRRSTSRDLAPWIM